MSGIARTQATGGAMIEALITWSSSIDDDAAFVREDLLGSAAHATMLGKTGIIPVEAARSLRGALLALDASAGAAVPMTGEEDVHMAVEALLTRTVGPDVAGRLHTARSRNDQVALDLRLFARDRAATMLRATTALGLAMVERAETETATLLAAYTHRQRAQPISAAFLLCAWTAQLTRAAETMAFALGRCNELALGAGACSGSSLPIDRTLTARLLGFPRITHNALDTVGDRDFALDLTWASARVMLALGKLSTDLVDFSTSEFAIVRLDGAIAAGSSMMPQKKNPDVFELVRGKSAHAVANVTHLLMLVKGLASGYNRDQQEDRRALLSSPPLVLGALDAVARSLPHVHFDRARGLASVADGFTQATDLAEALVQRGVPFREAYKAVGSLVRQAVDAGTPLRALTLEQARAAHAGFDAEALAVLDPARAVAAKESLGGTGPASIARQIEALRSELTALAARADAVPSLDHIARAIAQETL
jgi:argininosuccinate lyase